MVLTYHILLIMFASLKMPCMVLSKPHGLSIQSWTIISSSAVLKEAQLTIMFM